MLYEFGCHNPTLVHSLTLQIYMFSWEKCSAADIKEGQSVHPRRYEEKRFSDCELKDYVVRYHQWAGTHIDRTLDRRTLFCTRKDRFPGCNPPCWNIRLRLRAPRSPQRGNRSKLFPPGMILPTHPSVSK